MKELLYFLAGLLVASIGYFLKRWIERSPVREELDIQLKLLERNKQMKEQNVSEEDLEKMRQRLPTRNNGLSGIKEFANAPPEFRTQTEMFEYAENEFRTLQEELNLTLQLVTQNQSRLWIWQFEDSQHAWLNYRNKQAKFASEQYKGGSLEPFIYVTEASSLTRNRIAELRMMIAPWTFRRKTPDQ